MDVWTQLLPIIVLISTISCLDDYIEHSFLLNLKGVLDFCDTERKRGITEEEEVLEDEKKRTLSILQSVLGSSQQTCSNKSSSKAKTFKWVT